MTVTTVLWWLQLLSLLFCLAVLARLTQTRLVRVYPWFVSYLILTLSLQTIGVVYGVCSRQLCTAFPVLEPIRIAGYVVVVWELVGATRVRMAGIAGIASAGIILSMVVPGSHLYHGLILSIVRLERGVAFSLAVFIVLFLRLTSNHGIKMPRNGVALLIFWSLWFLGDSAMLTAASLLPAGRSFVVNDGLALFEIISYAGWTLLLRATRDKSDFVETTLATASLGGRLA